MEDQRYPLNCFWGKLKTDLGEETPVYHPLSHHGLDVATVFHRFVGLPAFLRCLATMADTRLTPAQLDRHALLAILLGFGKSSTGLQNKPFAPKVPRDWGELMSPLTPYGISLSEMVIPDHMTPKGEDIIQDLTLIANGISFLLGQNQHRYTLHGLEIIDEPAH
jgi:hypothetical protein